MDTEIRALRGCPRRLLAVFPHPDDESYGCAGALARAGVDPDTAAVVVCLTHGEAARMGPERGLFPPQLAKLRKARMREVADILQLDALEMPGLPDGGLARMALDALARPILEILRAYRPQVVIGHDPRGVNAHPDHIATHWALRHALLQEPARRFAMLVYPEELCEAIKPRLLFATPEEEFDAVLTLSEAEIEAKEACLRIHEALVTLREDGDASLLHRPPLERYDFLDEDRTPPLSDLFEGMLEP